MSAPASHAAPAWWEQRPYLAFLVLLAAVPLVWPPVPPLVDLMGHMGRYRVQLGGSEALGQYYGFEWSLIANLGIDLLIEPFSRLFRLELGTKLIVMAIPPLTVLGFLGIAREAHGRAPATAAFALPLAWGYPFQFGFVNFALSMALAFLAFWLWLRLGRMGRFGLRAGLFVPIGIVIWVAHTFGWAVLGLLAFSAELVRARMGGAGRLQAIWRAGLACLPLAPPALLMLAWRDESAGGRTADWFNWKVKWTYAISILRERWGYWDLFCAGMLAALVAVAAAIPRLRLRRMLLTAAVVLLIAYLLLPRILLGSAYADMRLAPFVAAVAVLAIRTDRLPRGWQAGIAAAALLFVGARVVTSTWAMVLYDRGYQSQLPALDHVRPGSRVLALAAITCQRYWHTSRMEHLSAMATVRREAFVNDQWEMPGAQLLSVRYRAGRPFVADPSQIVRPRGCRSAGEHLLEPALARIPMEAFDYLWLIDVPLARLPIREGLVPLWRGERSGALYRIQVSKP